jgi:hypothetical protein
VRYADDVLLAKEETILQIMIYKVIEVGRGYGMEINVEKTKTVRISRQPTPLQIKTDKKPVENVEEFNYLGSMITNDQIPEFYGTQRFNTVFTRALHWSLS